ncbi:hypothetical protein ESB00_08915 [Oleiharenicola lentus]|uniref:Uncharacterized protein n=1 Tax=Oleiharenicola lentus TaxID=2508720 RepID=A0A4Q1CAN2_9BACT|nr:hypothetical protein [Oleiharenicola lentus]RXK55980.1 hypothetical protein ESB00_08915 [Oleiharenicola lentus]
MLIKHALITALVTWLIILGAALGLAVHRNDVSVKSIIEYAWGVSFAVCILGVLFSSGASTGDTIERTEGVEKSSLNREGYRQADSQDAVVGIAFGTIVMISALLIFGGSLATLYLFFNQ